MGDNSSGAVIVRRRPWWTSLLAPIVAVVVVAGSAPACDGTATETTDPDGRGPRQPNATTTTLMVTRALNRLRESTRDYRLMDDLWFETLPPAAAFQPRPAPANLVQLADAVFDVRRLSWRNAIVDGMDLTLYKDRALQRYTFALTRHDRTADDQSSDTGTRTFGGHRRRMQLMLPIMYKLGVITTLLFGLTMLSVKGVTIGLILLMLAVTSIVTKLSKSQQQYAYGPPPPHWSAGLHDIYDRSSQQQPSYPSPPHEKTIHVHVHTAPGVAVSKGPPRPNDAGGTYWNRAADDSYQTYEPSADDYYYRAYAANGGMAAETSTAGVYHRWLGR